MSSTTLYESSSSYGQVEHELESLYRSSYSQLVGFACLFILPREVAEEVVQDVFTSLLSRALKSPSWSLENPEAYVKSAIALKARNVHRRGFLRVVKEEQANDSSSFAGEESDADLLDAINSLPTVQKECIIFKYFEDYTIAQTASALGIAEGTVKSHLFRATQSLKEFFESRSGKEEK